MRLPVLLLFLIVAAGSPRAAQSPDNPVPLLVVLAPTGELRDGLPVLVRHPSPSAHEGVLTRGFSGRLLRLFRYEQQFLNRRDGRAIEPAYLLLSTNQGGFPRFGFWLDGARKGDTGYVDLHQGSRLAGRFGAMDQIFPHELTHVIVQQLAGPPPPGVSGANQVHAIGVRTDPATAFGEGFAEHVQVLAVDDPDAAPETRALASDAALRARAARQLDEFRRALEARFALAPPARMGFVLWFSGTEQVLRYHAVKANAFAHEPSIAPRLLAKRDLYPAYLLENVLPGAADGPVKATPRLLSTEGAVAALFSRWVVEPQLQQPVADAGLYERFGVRSGDLAPLDHAYLKLFTAMADARPHDAGALVRAYASAFPGERETVASLARELGFDWPLPAPPPVWLASDRLETGTTLFDQYRALPRVHTFDLNAASLIDLLAIDGMTPALARAVQAHAPFVSVEALAQVPGMTPAMADRVRAMAQAMTRVREANAREDIESIDLMRLFRPVLVRAGLWLLAGAVAAAWLYGRVRRLPVWRLAVNGLAASAGGLLPAWVLGPAGLAAPALLVFTPVVAVGVPAALLHLIWRRSASGAGRVLVAWAFAALPALLVAHPLV
jgi:hypothetical protein